MDTHAIKDNGSAYEKWEVRNGPPLDYVAGKLRAAVEDSHALTRDIDRHVPGDLLVARGLRNAGKVHDLLQNSARASFYNTLKAYLALRNRLGLMDNSDLLDELMQWSTERFRSWLDEIDVSSSVHG